jgi:acyl carrier protein
MREEVAERVFALVGRQTTVRREELTLETDLFDDLSVDSDDARELLTALADEYRVNMDTLELDVTLDREGGQVGGGGDERASPRPLAT